MTSSTPKHHFEKSSTLLYFRWPFFVTAAGLGLGAFLGWRSTGTLEGLLFSLFICGILAVLEISLSFDNAIVNANKLRTMSPKWQKRFLTWGILIAVFGMRIVFPILIVVISAGIGPWEAISLSIYEPARYADIMHEAHLPIAAFGGTFLMLVGLSFFFDTEKEIHWIHWLETRVCGAATIRGIEIAVVLAIVLGLSRFMTETQTTVFLGAAIWGIFTFLAVEILGSLLDSDNGLTVEAAKGGLGAFLYLEVLDASFSFDGVIGAFALTQNLFIIAIGLGIGAMYVRSMTIMLVERQTLGEYRYLEHGAFYAVVSLSIVMFLQAIIHIPEIITGLFGASLIGLAMLSSIRWNRQKMGK